MNTFGQKTKPTVFLTHESHKLHKEFTTAAVVKRSQPCKIDATGKVVPLAAGDHRNLCIGISIHNAAAGENVTLVMKAFLTLLCQSPAATAAGPVQIVGYAEDTTVSPVWGVNTVETCAAADVDFFGVAIEPGTAGGYLEVIVNA